MKKESEHKNDPAAPPQADRKEQDAQPSADSGRWQREAAEYKDKWVRTMAEMDNLRKRSERERLQFVQYANEALVTEFLGILDDLERTVQAATSKHEDYENFLKGVELVMARVHEMLKKNDVRPMDAKGKPFDPHCHEVLMQEETDRCADGEVIEEFQKGYYLKDRVVRTAKVKVAVAPRPKDGAA